MANNTDALNNSLNALNTAVGAMSAMQNYALQKQQLAYQQTIDDWNKQMSEAQYREMIRQYEKNYAQSEYALNLTQSNYLNEAQIRTQDLARAGLNPLMYTGSSTVSLSPAQSSGVAGSSVNSRAQAPQIDPSLLNNFISQLVQNRFTDKESTKQQNFTKNENDKNRELEWKKLELEEKRIENDFLVATESNRLRAEELKQTIFKDKSDIEIAKQLANETARKNAAQEYFQKIGMSQEQQKIALSRLQQDRNYQAKINELARAEKQLNQTEDIADRDRRERYITSLTNSILSFFGRVASSYINKD